MNICYNHDFLTTYKSFQDEYYSDLCYKIQLLQALDMKYYDDFIIQQNMKKLYYFMWSNYDFVTIFII